MTVDIYCENMNTDDWFGTNNSGWITILDDFVKASLLFIKNYEVIDEDKEIFTEGIEKILKAFTNEEIQTEYHFRRLITKNEFFINILIYIGIGGMYSLLNKDPFGGRYTFGNSVDILETIKNIKPYIKNEGVIDILPDLVRVFQYSVDNKENVLKC